MRVLVCGGRNFGNYRGARRGTPEWKKADDERKFIFERLDTLQPRFVIAGAATGADTVAVEWAKANNIPFQEYPADWKRFGPSAGPKRNKQMLDEGQVDCVMAFPGGKGTWNMIGLAKKAKLPVIEPKYE